MRIGATRQALKHLDLLVEEEPNHLTTRIYRAKAEYEEGQYDKAIEDLKTALALTEEEKDLALLHRLLAANYVAQKEWKNAVDEATKAIDLHDEEPTSSLYKTKALVALEQWDEATEFLRSPKGTIRRHKRPTAQHLIRILSMKMHVAVWGILRSCRAISPKRSNCYKAM